MPFPRAFCLLALASATAGHPAHATTHDGAGVARLPIARSGYTPGAGPSGGGVVRTFRLAITTTGAYTQAMGGTTRGAMDGVSRTVARLNEIVGSELGIRFVLADHNERLIHLPGKKDPFRDITADLDIANLNARLTHEKLGRDGFDIGHVLDARGAAGVAGAIGNSCLPYEPGMDDPGRSKAAGMSGSDQPWDDAFIVGVVAHEIGHQLGAWHTFNGCLRSALEGAAVEPGGGSTIMGYAGHCGFQDLQAHADAYFHTVSASQIGRWLASRGGACARTELNTATAPWIDPESIASTLQVPARTPFRLAAEASFADPLAQLTYTFEQIDTGPAQYGDVSDTGHGVLFRSRPPTTSGDQTFPSMHVLLGHEAIGQGDAWPVTTRDLTFRLTIRDQLGHRSHAVTADRHVHVTDTGRAFALLSPTDSLLSGTPSPVTWDVAGTADEPILCSHVRIDLSRDGGASFADAPLVENAPNTGTASITLPANTAGSNRARLRVMCGNDTFFALSARDLTIL